MRRRRIPALLCLTAAAALVPGCAAQSTQLVEEQGSSRGTVEVAKPVGETSTSPISPAERTKEDKTMGGPPKVEHKGAETPLTASPVARTTSSTRGASGQAESGPPAEPVASAEPVSVLEQAQKGIKEGNVDSVLVLLQSRTTTSPNDPAWRYNLAAALLRAGHDDRAFAEAMRAVELSKGAFLAVKVLVACALEVGRVEDTLGYLEGLRSRFRKSEVALGWGMAELRLALGKASEALREARELLKKDETNVALMKTIAKAYMAMNLLEGAKLVLSEILEHEKDAEVYDMLGRLALRNREKRKAIAYFKKALEVDPDLVDVHNNLGLLYLEAQDAQGAAGEFKAALKLRKNYLPAMINLASALIQEFKVKEAKDVLRKALKLDPDCADCYFNLGVAYMEDKPPGQEDEPEHYRQAIEYFKKYKELRTKMRPSDLVDKYLSEARRVADYLERRRRAKPAAQSKEDSEGAGGKGGSQQPAVRTEEPSKVRGNDKGPKRVKER